MTGSVFISYSGEDKEQADRICAALEKEGISCWIAPRDIQPGDTWAATIVKALSEAKLMLVLLSTHSNRSDQIPREVELADARRVAVMPVRLENVEPAGALEYYLRNRQWVDVYDRPPGLMEQDVVDAVMRRLGEPPRPGSHVPVPQPSPISSKRRFGRYWWVLALAAVPLAWILWSYFTIVPPPEPTAKRQDAVPPAPGVQDLKGPADVFEKSKRSVVRINLASGGYGSGFIVGFEGHLLTADYVLQGKGPWQVTTWDGSKRQAELVGVNKETKLGVARILSADKLAPLAFRAAKIAANENVLVIGSTQNELITYEQGIVTADEGALIAASFARFATAGLGGGPVVDQRGESVGVYYQRKMQTGDSGESIRLFLPASTAIATLRRFGVWIKVP